MDWEQGKFLQERYYLMQRLGAHGNRQTWLAFDQHSEQPVVLKALRFALNEQTLPDRRLAQREAETLQSISLEAVPRFREWFDFHSPTGTYFCLVLDYIPGESLAARVRRDGPLSIEQAKNLAAEVLSILQELHSLAPPVIHRDIKPDNLISSRGKGRIYLVDFGSVQAQVGSGQTLTVVGTYGYMAPEQFAGLTGPTADLYGLGATVLFALSGKNPADWPRRGLRLQLRGLEIGDENLCAWLEQMLEPDPIYRFANSAQALAALRQPESRSQVAAALLASPRLHITLSYDRKQLELQNTDWRSYLIPIAIQGAGAFVVGTGLDEGITLISPTLVAIGTLLFALGVRELQWQWRLVFDGQQRWLMRVLFGRVFERRALPASVQIGTQKENEVYSVALVTPNARRYWLGKQYTKLEAQRVSQSLRMWLDETD